MGDSRLHNKFIDVGGFSLSELVSTLGVFSIIAAIGIPNYRAAQPGLNLNGGTRHVLSKLIWARSQAVEENTTYSVSFPNGHTLKIFHDANGNGMADLLEWSEITDLRTNYPDVSLSQTGTNPRFNGRGTASGSTLITLSNSSGSKAVSVSTTGNVKIN